MTQEYLLSERNNRNTDQTVPLSISVSIVVAVVAVVEVVEVAAAAVVVAVVVEVVLAILLYKIAHHQKQRYVSACFSADQSKFWRFKTRSVEQNRPVVLLRSVSAIDENK